MLNPALIDFYRCPESFASYTLAGPLSEDSGFFCFGQDTNCYGQCSSGFRAKRATEAFYDALGDVTADGAGPCLPFNPAQVIENLRCERYVSNSHDRSYLQYGATWNAYHLMRPFLPVSVRKHLQKIYLKGWKEIRFPNWPVDCTVERVLERLLVLSLRAQGVEKIPFIWFWPGGAPSCGIVTHDVETLAGRDFCSHLMDMDDSVGIKSSFQIVPEQRYSVAASFLDLLRKRGFEINVHDLNHDGRLFSNRELFLRRVERINHYGKQFAAAGFRSGSLYRNMDWIDALDFSYDMSIPNVAHLEAQRGGCCTVMPFFIGKILELPLTTAQDYSLFHILRDYSLDLWKRQIALITEKHGLANFIIHPDYIIEQRAQRIYRALLDHLVELRADGVLWIALPREVNQWWRERSKMKVVRDGSRWRIEGEGKERARLAFATLVGGELALTIEEQH
jgi:hypothetical protein